MSHNEKEEEELVAKMQKLRQAVERIRRTKVSKSSQPPQKSWFKRLKKRLGFADDELLDKK